MRAAAHVGAVEVDREDLVLGVLELHRQREDRLLGLALERAAAAVGLVGGLAFPLGRVVFDPEAEQLGGLLRDGRAAVARERPAPFAEVDPHGAGDAAGRQAEVLVEALVLGRDDGVPEVRRDRPGGDHAAVLLAPPGEGVAVAVEQRDGPARAPVGERGGVGQAGVDVADHEGEDQPGDETGAPGQAPDEADDEGDDRRDPAQGPATARPRGGFARGGLLLRRLAGFGRGFAVAPVGHEPSLAGLFLRHFKCPARVCALVRPCLSRFLAGVEQTFHPDR